MKQLIIHGDPEIRKDAVLSIDGEEVVCFGINRMGEWHGPDRVQLWCTVGTEDEREAYELRSYIPHFLDVEHYDADEVTVVEAAA
ncbi:hypothetical protein C479_03216 [Halovivax asiaticus JCM 14624]|uniref:Uncharacterized protein n=1 Tax=Halovivax asiaticus JCM 14624 TaxID=1227490 RepID=M0BUN0_9EURY|nr:HAH_0734 family protein [Halovivax asiaticus]ELZ13822.1 hypothetical protein C479_03216 [Halovivax asiaticus JCM 14624]